MWGTRRKNKAQEEDKELRDLVRTYAQLHETANAPKTQQSFANSTNKQAVKPSPETTSAPPVDSPDDEVIQGRDLSYTHKEAKIYAKEDPCDLFRHMDVSPSNRISNTRITTIINCIHYITALTFIAMDSDAQENITGRISNFAIKRRIWIRWRERLRLDDDGLKSLRSYERRDVVRIFGRLERNLLRILFR